MRKHIFKKIFLFILILASFSSVFAIPEKDADGYYLVKTAEEFEWCLNPELMSLEQVHKVKVMADIDLSYGGKKQKWKKVDVHNFEILGQGHAIKLPCNEPAYQNVFGDPKFHLFNTVTKATIKGIHLFNIMITSTSCPSLIELSAKKVISCLLDSDNILYNGEKISRIKTTVDTMLCTDEPCASGKIQLYGIDGTKLFKGSKVKKELYKAKILHGLHIEHDAGAPEAGTSESS